MADPIQIGIVFSGGEAAAQSADAVAGSLDDVAAAALQTATRSLQAGAQVQALSQRLLGAATAVTNLARGMSGSEGLVGRMTAVTDAAGTLGSLFGPTGALVGGIVSLAGRAIPSLLESLMGVPPAQREVEETTRQASSALQEQAAAAYDAAAGLDAFLTSASTSGRRRELAVLGEEIANLADQLASARGSSDAVTRLGAGDIADQIRRASTRADEMRAELESEGAFGTRRGGAGGSRRSISAQIPDGPAGSVMDTEAEERLLALGEERLAVGRALGEMMQANGEKQREAIQGEIDLREAQKNREIAAQDEQLEKIAELTAAQETASRAALESHQAQVQSYQQVTGVIVGGLTDALSSIIAGQKSAEEAFLSLLASFLQFISEQAAIKAAFEFAEAIASIPAAPLVASHLAAGIAFTGVAVAAGAGSAVAGAAAGDVASKSAAARDKPSNPESRSGGGKGGTTIVINQNSPVLSYGSQAELGRAMGTAIGVAQRRYG